MESTNLYDVATQAICRHFKKADQKRVRAGLLALDPLSPKRSYQKLSKILAISNSGLRSAILN